MGGEYAAFMWSQTFKLTFYSGIHECATLTFLRLWHHCVEFFTVTFWSTASARESEEELLWEKQLSELDDCYSKVFKLTACGKSWQCSISFPSHVNKSPEAVPVLVSSINLPRAKTTGFFIFGSHLEDICMVLVQKQHCAPLNHSMFVCKAMLFC